jgi:uncharacterized protein (DUF1501 family)
LFYTVEENFTESAFPHLRTAAEREAAGNPAQAHEAIYKKAFDLTLSPLRTVFEVKNEPAKVIEEYGGQRNAFGMGCLLARKLVEQGVTAVEVDLGGWDTHGNNFGQLRNNLGPRLDKGMGALVKDLVERGLWKNTVILWMGEFGRTPRINKMAGRDHWPQCYTALLAGGGVKRGHVHGASDKIGAYPASDPVRPEDLAATMFHLLGIDPKTEIRDALNRPLPISAGEVIHGVLA